MNATE